MELRNKLNLTEIQPAEYPEVVQLVNSAYRGDSSKQGWTTEADYLDGQRTDLHTLADELKDKDKKTLFVLREQNSPEIIGTVLLEKINDAKGPGCYLGMLTIKPTTQNAGLGKIMMNLTEQQIKAWGLSRVILGVLNPREELMAWYERRGYQKTGEKIDFPYGQEQFGLPKTKGLHFVMFEKTL